MAKRTAGSVESPRHDAELNSLDEVASTTKERNDIKPCSSGDPQGMPVQGVASAVDNALDGVRKAINSMVPGKPNLAESFTPLDLNILLAGGFGDANNLGDATAEELLRSGLCGARVFDLEPGLLSPWRRRSLEEVLYAPLPDVEMDNCLSDRDQYKDWHTHPTRVEEWPDWELDVKKRLQEGTEGWKKDGYTAVGEISRIYVASERAVTSLILSTMGSRVNEIYWKRGGRRKGLTYAFTPSLPSESETASGDSCQEPEEVLQGAAPDVCLVDTTVPEWSVFQTTLCKMKYHLANAEDWSMPGLWNARKDGEAIGDADLAHRVTSAVSEILGFMSRRGHGTGTICTYSHTWLLKTDKKGLVQITPAIRHDQKGTSTKVSVTELFLYSAISNIDDGDRTACPTARSPGAEPISREQLIHAVARAHSRVYHDRLRYEASCRISGPSPGKSKSTRSGVFYSADDPLPQNKLYLTTRLANDVYFGGFAGQVALVRLVSGDDAITHAKQEVVVYQRMEYLQGDSVPELLAHGYTAEGKAYFVATKYIEGIALEHSTEAHIPFIQKLKQALDQSVCNAFRPRKRG